MNIAQYFSSGIVPNGSRGGFVSLLAAPQAGGSELGTIPSWLGTARFLTLLFCRTHAVKTLKEQIFVAYSPCFQ